MPKPGVKEKKQKSKQKSKSTSKVSKKRDEKKVSRSKKLNPEDGIAKSKQLIQRLNNSKSSSGGSKSRSGNDEVRLCGNGKPMPSLAELEKMFEDSDNDEETKVQQPESKRPTSTEPVAPQLTSPKTINKIADRLLDFISNLTEPPISLDDDGPPPPIIKPKKRKKTEIPYIVGCKERPYVPFNPNTSFCKGDEEYGVDPNNCDDEDDLPKKRAKRTKRVNLSKSIFNATSDEIAARLKELDDSDTSADSNKTVAYEYYTPNQSRTRSFSPLPSTSKDNETFVKNDQLFNESLISENASTSYMEDDVQIVETPCETIVINDTLASNKSIIINEDPSLIDITEKMDDTSAGRFNSNKNIEITSKSDDDSVEIVTAKPAKSPSPIPVEEYYSISCALKENTPPSHDDVCEIIDIDDIIAENSKIIKKYSQRDINTVTSVDMSNSIISVNDNTNCSINDGTTESGIRNISGNAKIPDEQVTVIDSSDSVAKSSDGNLTNQDNMIPFTQNELQEMGKILNTSPNDTVRLMLAINYFSKKPHSSTGAGSTSLNPQNPICNLVTQGKNDVITY